MTSFPARAVAVGVCFALTGAAGLIYQVAWFRFLGLAFGVTAQAASAVLAAFMLGLALGALLVGPALRSRWSPLRLYGAAEIAIGLCGIVSLSALELLQPLYRAAAPLLGDPAPLRFLLAILAMALPTTLMGATLPLAVAGVGAGPRTVGALYGANTLGAVLGAVGAAFVLIGTFGLDGAVNVAVAINLAVGAVWLGLGRASRWASVGGQSAGGRAVLPGWARGMALGVYGVSGAAALANEVVWTRVLAGVFPVSVYAFGLVLGIVLAGIALGSWLATPFTRAARRWLAWFAGAELLIAAGCLWAIWAFGRIYVLEGMVRPIVGAPAPLMDEPWFLAFAAAFALGPAALALGVAFPVAARVYVDGDPARLGRLYGANTLGALAGSLLGGLVLIPALGATSALWLLAGVNVLCALALAAASANLEGGRRMLSGALVAAAAASIAFAALGRVGITERLWATNPFGNALVWLDEGPDATVTVSRWSDGTLDMRINSAGQGSDRGDGLRFHATLGHLGPLLFEPDAPPRALVVGLGTGATAGAVAQHQRAQVEILELHDGVVRASDLFKGANLGVLSRPNVWLEVNDARNHLLVRPAQYDLIVADLILPTNAGAANLYSRDYYRLARESLSERGLLVQWLNPGLSSYAYKMMARTFLAEFPDATLWSNGAILVGGRTGGSASIARRVAEASQDPALAAALRELDLASPDAVLRRFTADGPALRAHVGAGPIITDRTPWIEYYRSLPDDGLPTAWVRAAQAAQLLRTDVRPGDVVVFGDSRVFDAFRIGNGTTMEAFWPRDGASRDAVRESVRRFAAGKGRVWFVPFPGERTEQDRWAQDALGPSEFETRAGELLVLRYPPR